MPTKAPAGPRKGGWLKVSFTMRPNTLNPLKHVNSAEYMLGEMMYSGLTRLGPKMEPVPDLAVAWEPNADLTEWTFKLRQGVKFHTGDVLTPKDVVATFKAILDPAVASPGAKNVGPIESVAEKGDDAVVFKLQMPFADLPTSVAYTDAKIIPAKALDKFDDLATGDFGSGPFKLVEFVPGSVAKVERNPDYFMKDRPYLDGMIQAIYPDSTAAVGALLNKDIDLITEVDPAQYGRLFNQPGVEPLRSISGQFLNMVLGCDTPPFNDPRVRKALALTLDRKQLVDIVLEGYGSPAYDNPISTAYRFGIQVPERTRDIEKAKALLAEAGYSNGVDLTLHAAERPGSREVLAVAVKEMAAPAGFRITVQKDAYDLYLAQVWKKANFYVGLYNMQPTIDSLFYLLYTSNASWNESRWNNAAFDELVLQARQTIDEAKRADLYAKAQMMLHEEVPNVVPFHMNLLGGRRDYVKDFELHPRGAVYWMDNVWLTEDAPKRG
ncbi:MAG: ABC transporter substrate-binding protein [Anaerolineae bacterium]